MPMSRSQHKLLPTCHADPLRHLLHEQHRGFPCVNRQRASVVQMLPSRGRRRDDRSLKTKIPCHFYDKGSNN
jgi:hypothetical protein